MVTFIYFLPSSIWMIYLPNNRLLRTSLTRRRRGLTFDLRNENINTRTLDCRPLVGKPYPLVLLDFRRGAFCVYLVRQTWFPLATYYCIHSRVFRGIPWIYSGRPYPSTPQSQKWLSPTRREMNIASNKWVHLTRRKRRRR